jgi:hypothetical protein
MTFWRRGDLLVNLQNIVKIELRTRRFTSCSGDAPFGNALFLIPDRSNVFDVDFATDAQASNALDNIHRQLRRIVQ